MVSLARLNKLDHTLQYDRGDPNIYLDLSLVRKPSSAATHMKEGLSEIDTTRSTFILKPTSRLEKPKFTPRNHLRENVVELRKMQHKNREKASAEIGSNASGARQPVKALWKSSKYEAVQSKVKEQLENEVRAERPNSGNFLRAHSRTSWVVDPDTVRPQTAEPPPPPTEYNSRPQGPPLAQKVSPADVQLIRRDLDYIQLNGRAAKCAPTRRQSATERETLGEGEGVKGVGQQHAKGELPKYLVRRKMQWLKDDEEKKANAPDPDMPPGHRLMADAQRVETLAKLQQSEQELLRQLQEMPLRTDTLRMRTRKDELERKLEEVCEAQKIFSRPKVFVQLDT